MYGYCRAYGQKFRVVVVSSYCPLVAITARAKEPENQRTREPESQKTRELENLKTREPENQSQSQSQHRLSMDPGLSL